MPAMSGVGGPEHTGADTAAGDAEVYDMSVQDAPQMSAEQWIEVLKARLRGEGMYLADLPDVADSNEFNTVLRELGFGTALDRMAIRKAARGLRERFGMNWAAEMDSIDSPREGVPNFGHSSGQGSMEVVSRACATPGSAIASSIGDRDLDCVSTKSSSVGVVRHISWGSLRSSAASCLENPSEARHNKHGGCGRLPRNTRSQSEGPRAAAESSAGALPAGMGSQLLGATGPSPSAPTASLASVQGAPQEPCALQHPETPPQRGAMPAAAKPRVSVRAASPVLISSPSRPSPVRIVQTQPVVVRMAPTVVVPTAAPMATMPSTLHPTMPASAASSSSIVFVPVLGAASVFSYAPTARTLTPPPPPATRPRGAT
mmetsp:Transcript_16269/g.46284  ORF Transcript_16269/g.46284 Transcript_16269/m.46284 type:complete len:373 (+) Transcript_16269:134-1252(+)